MTGLTPEALQAARLWFRTEARTFPWSETDDPYTVWISEIMLQQTVVTAAVEPFKAWMARWPDLKSLAAADEVEVLRAWEGLGYASRARNLHRTARTLVAQGRNSLPSSEVELRTLPGIGEYTAAALLSFAFHQPALTLDANLKRVFQRLDGEPAWTPSLEARWRQIWTRLVDGPASRESNQAVMQLGQRLCRPRTPSCGDCPLAPGCRTRAEGLWASVPAPKARQTLEKATVVGLWHRKGSWWLAQPTRGRFSALWLAPGFESRPPELDPGRPLTPRVHTYTKYRDRLTPFLAEWSSETSPPLPPGWKGRWVPNQEAQELGMVSVYRKILDEAASLLG